MPTVRDTRFGNFSISATGDLVAAIPNAKIVVIAYAVVNTAGTANSIRFRSGTGTNISGVLTLPTSVGGGLVFAGTPDGPAFETGFGQALNALLGAATQVDGHFTYTVVRA